MVLLDDKFRPDIEFGHIRLDTDPDLVEEWVR
jgi:hypothetical protein